jgi:hypothetical protein
VASFEPSLGFASSCALILAFAQQFAGLLIRASFAPFVGAYISMQVRNVPDKYNGE